VSTALPGAGDILPSWASGKGPADCRKGIEGLARLCRGTLRQDPFRGYVFLFGNLTMGVYTHLRLLDKAKALDKLPVLSEKARRVITGTDDSAGYSTENPIKIRENLAKSVQADLHRKEGGSHVNPFEGKDLRRFVETRPEGFEPPTDGLEIRCSILLSYGRGCSGI
jgi:hypothetical protein